MYKNYSVFYQRMESNLTEYITIKSKTFQNFSC